MIRGSTDIIGVTTVNTNTNETSIPMDEQTIRALALTLAVLHHGLANFAEKSIPAKSDTVMETAKKFEDWLLGKAPVKR